jgi:hypothetical protein
MIHVTTQQEMVAHTHTKIYLLAYGQQSLPATPLPIQPTLHSTFQNSVSQHFFHGGTPKIIFHIARNPSKKMFTGQKKVTTTSVATLLQYATNMDTVQFSGSQIQTDQNKTKQTGSWWGIDIMPVVPIDG